MFENIAIGIVIYNPPEAVWENISFLVRLNLRVWIIDNSNSELKILIPDVEFYRYNANHGGLAKALNILCERAQKLNLDWLLTLDQDFNFESEKDIMNLLEHTKKTENDVGILAPKIVQFEKVKLGSFVMTSGTLLRMQAQKECGYYCEYFFIDALDIEYCLRLQSYGWKIKIVEDSLLNHALGAMIDKYIPFIKKHIYVTDYSPERLYYIARNFSITINHYRNKFPNTCKIQKKFLFFLIIKIFLYEKNICAKFKMILRGFLDARKEMESKCVHENLYATSA